jgi:ferritin-like metal-binding protein YciE
MRDLYRHLLAEAHDAERHTLMMLDEMETEMSAADGRDRVRRYRETTARQVDTLERCMELLGGAAPRLRSAALHGLREDRQAMSALAPAPSALELYDVAVLGRIAEGAAAAFRTLAALAAVCEQGDARRLFERALVEEEETAAWCAASVPVLAAGASLTRRAAVAV